MRATNSYTIGKAFQDQAEKNPNKAALYFLGKEYTYKKICNWALAFANSIAEMGIEFGDRVIIYLPNGPQFIISWLGILMRGAVAVPITPIYTSHDLSYIANDSGAKAIVCADTNYGYIEQVLLETSLSKVVYTNAADLLPIWDRAFGALFDRVPKGKVGRKEYSVSFMNLLKHKPENHTFPRYIDDEMALILYTGGTTKFPKGVPITHRQFMTGSPFHFKVHESLIAWGQNIILQGAPLFHVLGQVLGIGPLCICGDTLLLIPRMNLDGLLDTIKLNMAKTLIGVPALYRMILDHDRLDSYDLSSLRYCFTGGDVLPTEVAKRWMERFGIQICQGYGSTETVGGVSMTYPDKDNPPQAMGQVMPHKTVRIVDPETLQEVPFGTPGEILVNSDPMVESYWNKPDETKKAFIKMDGRLWYRTADIATMDKEKYLYFVDRTVDTIKYKGYRISASEIESVLLEHPAVVGACAVGVRDSRVGNRIKAYVVLKEDIKGMTGYDLIHWCREKLITYKVPHYIEFRDMLPKSKVGKLLRREIRKEEKKRQEKGKWEDSLSDST